MKHKADGLYYMSAEIARQNNACLYAQRAWKELYGERDVLVTLDQMTQFCEKYVGSASWIIAIMYAKNMLNWNQSVRLDDAALEAECNSPAEEARVVMNALLTRAKNEGRLSR